LELTHKVCKIANHCQSLKIMDDVTTLGKAYSKTYLSSIRHISLNS